MLMNVASGTLIEWGVYLEDWIPTVNRVSSYLQDGPEPELSFKWKGLNDWGG